MSSMPAFNKIMRAFSMGLQCEKHPWLSVTMNKRKRKQPEEIQPAGWFYGQVVRLAVKDWFQIQTCKAVGCTCSTGNPPLNALGQSSCSMKYFQEISFNKTECPGLPQMTYFPPSEYPDTKQNSTCFISQMTALSPYPRLYIKPEEWH